MSAREIPGPCPVCGAVSIAPAVQRSTLLAVSDVLILKVLERLGNHILRHERGEYRRLSVIPASKRHMFILSTPERVDWALSGAWDVIPAMLTEDGVAGVPARVICGLLDNYVHEVVRLQAPHSVPALRRRFHDQLGLPMYDLETAVA